MSITFICVMFYVRCLFVTTGYLSFERWFNFQQLPVQWAFITGLFHIRIRGGSIKKKLKKHYELMKKAPLYGWWISSSLRCVQNCMHYYYYLRIFEVMIKLAHFLEKIHILIKTTRVSYVFGEILCELILYSPYGFCGLWNLECVLLLSMSKIW